jgi:hypothetical protein
MPAKQKKQAGFIMNQVSDGERESQAARAIPSGVHLGPTSDIATAARVLLVQEKLYCRKEPSRQEGLPQ